MSFLFGGAPQNAGTVDPVKMEMATVELDMVTDMFNRLVNSCHAKCIQPDPRKHWYAEADLNKGEAVCIDRCTAKFFEVNKKVGDRLNAMGGQAQATGSFGM
ncbi:hypothetical protein CcaverHIS002_0112760 [Cutaneotrichosporon cavernicola]|uniref:Mitochondrial import inner membrane translocase subunit n=1 Tax=Cutaneotrichosporon cavernicola TaxID=279322 RepID=A0AA48I7K5_9TREE|nr:uncharacterized protein CcaverHIS019_0112630 [Cutaneotrichosporon cavernicola]BEJ17642.1 hypothetical protein CspHIS471_0610430 [Cutaneotrichosporon sp. HIS471]BEI80747.1 hypothetical protein CcaverHIS002_0112760 [Cutaneotrichosporon cavernicola]BEI88545.1 hypothetical protein CcaverHIS019_0112630 [Cutaneotrichosporon cavernicola]BEI96318.1 hypothetical protein CcaverHIS631_0112670 [Cutaneotrichosporon cavernicola]BEJ04089.1 hypothetical protein CcaverHIS641_0112640 [Cutaneotrichosporon cav